MNTPIPSLPAAWARHAAALAGAQDTQGQPRIPLDRIEASRPVAPPDDAQLRRGVRVHVKGTDAIVRFVPILTQHGNEKDGDGHAIWRWIAPDHEGCVRAFTCPVCKKPIEERAGLVPFEGVATVAELREAHMVRASLLQFPTPAGLDAYSRPLHEKFRRQRSARLLATLSREGEAALARWIEGIIADAVAAPAPEQIATHEDLAMGPAGSGGWR